VLKPASFRTEGRLVALRKPANRKLAISLTAEQFRYGFGNVLPEQESAERIRPLDSALAGQAAFEAAVANSPRSHQRR